MATPSLAELPYLATGMRYPALRAAPGSPNRQRQGLGSKVLRAVEESIRAVNGRLVLIETSNKSSFERNRLFYQKYGYSEVARIPDYFTDGDGKVSSVKRF